MLAHIGLFSLLWALSWQLRPAGPLLPLWLSFAQKAKLEE